MSEPHTLSIVVLIHPGLMRRHYRL